MSNVAAKFEPVVSGENRISVALEGDEAVISMAIWEEGLGWCTQKTMRFESSLLGDLHALVSAARIRSARSATAPQRQTADGKLIKFPA